ncbi:hypothetical protein A243_28797 [Pseudomonas syringae pv. actinidiae ICMP 18883]|nr:hypothetical protein A243_28797 [Pseudomonas syringae pv. actinidiae ICMP 18883]
MPIAQETKTILLKVENMNLNHLSYLVVEHSNRLSQKQGFQNLSTLTKYTILRQEKLNSTDMSE